MFPLRVTLDLFFPLNGRLTTSNPVTVCLGWD